MPKARRKPVRRLEPTGIALEYGKAINRVVGQAWALARKTVFPELPKILSEARARGRFDAKPKDVNALFDALSEAFFGSLNTRKLEDLAGKFADRTVSFERDEFRKQVNSALGVDVFLAEPNLVPSLEAFAAENVALIKSVPNTLFDRLEKLTTGAIREGKRWEDLAKELQDQLGVSQSHARLIARDQVGKLTSGLDRIRQKELGVEAYFWRTVNDNRVREEHQRREGKRFLWSDPPSGGHPGSEILCRCYAEADFSNILGES